MHRKNTFLLLRLLALILISPADLAATTPDNLFARKCELILVSDSDATPTVSSANDMSDVSTLVAKNRIAATQLAVQHLATRNGSVVEDVSSMQCTVDFTVHTIMATSHLSAIQGIVEHYAPATSTNNNDAEETCIGIVGPFQRQTIDETRALSQSLNISQVTVGAVNPSVEQMVQNLTSETHQPWTRNNYVQTSDLVRTAVQYWNSGSNHRSHISILYDIAGLDTLFSSFAESRRDLQHVKFAFFPMATRTVTSREGLRDLLGDTLREVKEFGYHTLMGAFEDMETILPLLAEIADRDFQLVGGDNLWTFLTGVDQTMFPQNVVATLQGITSTNNDSLHRILKGSALIRPLDGFHQKKSLGLEDAFLQTWRSWNATQLNEYSNHHNDNDVDEEAGADHAIPLEPNFFQVPENGPLISTSFIYDAVLSLGFHFCNGHKHSLSFHGASGLVQYDSETAHSRKFETVAFGVYNIRAIPDSDGLEMVLVSVRDAGAGDMQWRGYKSQDATVNTNFIYHDGSTTPPTGQRLDGSGSYINRSVRTAGLSLMAISLVVIVSAAVWVRIHKTQPVVKAGQPEFLFLICLGAIILASSVFPASLDEQAGYDKDQLQVACVAIPWLFCLGAISIDCALFCKLWRINKLFQFKRRSVTVIGVLGPFAFFMVSCVLVLTVWSIFYPLTWERRQVSEIPYVTSGSCEGDHLEAFAVPLLILTMAPTLLTAIMAWKTRDIPGDYAQTQWIFNALLVMTQVWIVGVPTFVVLGNQNNTVLFLGYAIMVLIYAVAAVVLVIAPQVYTVWVETKGNGNQPTSRVKTTGQPLGQGGVVVSGLSKSSATTDNVMMEQTTSQRTQEGP